MTTSLKNSYGFNLIELMVTVGIMTVIAGIAFPIYTGYVDTTRHTEAQNEFAAVHLAQSEFFLENNTYFGPVANAADPTAASGGLYTTQAANLDYFDIAIAAGPCGALANCYTITATGKNEMLGQNVTADGP